MSAPPAVTLLPLPLKSADDEREYRIFQLANGLKCVLVSDPTTEKAAASLDVNVGHFSDPWEIPGLAHFLEHMLFLGTEKYPDENSYSVFLSKYGGSSNAYTSMEHTNYYFDVGHANLDEALDRFAQFFIAPLFTPGATDREMNAVHNENAKNLQVDSRRNFQLLKSLCNPKHPMAKFGTGNLQTLRDEPLAKGLDIRKELLNFHKTYYSASIMSLAVIGRESLDQLQHWVTSRFGAIASTGRARPSFLDCGAPFTPLCGKLVKIVPIKNTRQIKLRWAFPSVFQEYRSKPASAISHLIGHEGPGSIHALLKAQGLISTLSSGLHYDEPEFSSFAVSIELTPEGLNRWQEVVQTIYAYIELVKSMTDEQWALVHKETSEVDAMSFRFKGKETPYNYAPSLAANLLHYAPQDLLSGGYLHPEFNVSRVRELASLFTPQNALIELHSKAFAGSTDQVEKWYQTEYKLEDVDEKTLSSWTAPALRSGLHLPAPNEFIATDFTLVYPKPVTVAKCAEKSATAENVVPSGVSGVSAAVPTATVPVEAQHSAESPETLPVPESTVVLESKEDREPPQLIVDSPCMRAWHKLDKTFFKPKTFVQARLLSPLANESPAARTLIALYAKMVADLLNEYTYDADLAGLHYSCSASTRGLDLAFDGYSQKLPILIQKVIGKVASGTVVDERFVQIKEKMTREFRDFSKDQPHGHASYNQQMALEYRVWHYEEKVQVIDRLTADDLRQYAKQFLSQGYLETLIHGNISAEDAKQLANTMATGLKLSTATVALHPAQLPYERTVNLAANTRYVHKYKVENEGEINACCKAYYQMGADVLPTRATLMVLAHLMDEPCYNQLRTIEQLGYLCWSGMNVQNGTIGLYITVQSSNRPPLYLESRIEAFLEAFRGKLAELSDEEIRTNIRAVIEELQEKPKTLSAQSSKYWKEIQRRRYQFNLVPREVAFIQQLSKADLVAFFDRHLRINGPERRKFVAHVSPFNGDDSMKLPEEVKSPTSAAASAPTPAPAVEPAQLPAVPEDRAPTVEIGSFHAFIESMPLHPNYWLFADREITGSANKETGTSKPTIASTPTAPATA